MAAKAFVFLWLGVLILTVVLHQLQPIYFQRFIGGINPIIAMLLSGVVGFFLLNYLFAKGWFYIYRQENFKTPVPYYSLALLFPLVAIFVDWQIVFPAEMNIPFPESLLFYPAIAFLVEILFHVLPLTLLMMLGNVFIKISEIDKWIWVVIFLVALLEPTYQIWMDDYSVWAMVIIWINLYLFNLTQLIVFKKYDFLSMYLCRLIYYLIWHIIWGYFRLTWLFG